ncbi:MAG: hypothetical protein GX752_07840 [Clostridium sp.]|nr:hypothetical protein [Clostridium sp.]
MKLIIAIVNDEDSIDVIDLLTEQGYRVTKLATTGGFLKSGNTTLMIGVEKDKVKEALEIVEETCKTRKQVVTNPSPFSTTSGVYVPYPVDVEVGGATIFVLDVDQFFKI